MSHLSRSRTRKFLYQMLYASTFSKIENDSFREAFFSWIFDASIDEEYLQSMFESIIKNEEFLIEVLTMYAPKFDIENMDLSYVLPIFIGTTEILIFPEEIPVKVSINEAVEISKIYGDDSSRKMVNGVLNNVLKNEEQLINKFKLFKSTTYKNIFFWHT